MVSKGPAPVAGFRPWPGANVFSSSGLVVLREGVGVRCGTGGVPRCRRSRWPRRRRRSPPPPTAGRGLGFPVLIEPVASDGVEAGVDTDPLGVVREAVLGHRRLTSALVHPHAETVVVKVLPTPARTRSSFSVMSTVSSKAPTADRRAWGSAAPSRDAWPSCSVGGCGTRTSPPAPGSSWRCPRRSRPRSGAR